MIYDSLKIVDALAANIIMLIMANFSIWFYLYKKQQAVPKWTRINIDYWVIPKQKSKINRHKFNQWLTGEVVE